jgi:hypothetical protein
MKKFWVENILDNPACAWSEVAPPSGGFIDRTNDLVYWDKYGKNVLDLDRYRYEMKTPFYTQAGLQLENWATLSAEIKEIAARMFFVPYILRLTVVSEEQDYLNWEVIIDKTQGAPTDIYVGRAKTFDVMRKVVAHRVRKELLSMSDSQQMLKDVGQMADWFIRANSPDFKQWIINEVGTPYENNGFQQTTYYNQTLKDELYDIYNGNY